VDRRRVAALLKIALLVGAPLMIVLGLFSWGVHLGFTYERPVKTFERDLLGMDVEVPEAGAVAAAVALTEPAADGETGGVESTDTDAADTAAPADPASESGTTGADAPPPQPAVEKPAPSPSAVQPRPTTATPALAFVGAAIPPEQRARFDRTRIVRVKAFADARTIAADPDWIISVVRAFDSARAGWRTMFGIELRLVSVSEWEVPADLDSGATLADLRTRERESADLMMGFVGNASAADHEARETDPASAPSLPRALLVPTSGTEGIDALRTMHALGHAFGAADAGAADPASTGPWSFMESRPPVPEVDVSVDADALAAILSHKDAAFAEPTAAPSGIDAAEQEEREDG
jgi:hypothetical protein